ncbi:MAG TPA: hypothetical protein VL463_16455 [Kofleriaceae bacterium]|nr:hypothetical protein [Kofleriaceae bacterium]
MARRLLFSEAMGFLLEGRHSEHDLVGAIADATKRRDDETSRRRLTKRTLDELPADSKLRALCAAICVYLADATKCASPRRARADFAAMCRALDDGERRLLIVAIAKDQTAFFGYALDARVHGAHDRAPTVRAWLQAMIDR